jgi:hypothetical protein
MLAKKPDLVRRVRTFKKQGKSARLNYTSLRRMFFDLIVQEFESSCRDAARGLSGTLAAPANRRAHRRSFGGESLYQRVIDRCTVTFNQVDALALHHQLPMAAILLFSRIRSELEHGREYGSDRALKILNAFKEAMLVLEDLVQEADVARRESRSPNFDIYEVMNHEAFLRFRHVYRAASGLEDPQLGLPLTDD